MSYRDVQQRFGLLVFKVVSVQRDVFDLPALSEQQVCSRGDGVNVGPRCRTHRGRSHCLVNTCVGEKSLLFRYFIVHSIEVEEECNRSDHSNED